MKTEYLVFSIDKNTNIRLEVIFNTENDSLDWINERLRRFKHIWSENPCMAKYYYYQVGYTN